MKIQIKKYTYCDNTFVIAWCCNIPDDNLAWSVSIIEKRFQAQDNLICEDKNGKPFSSFESISKYCDQHFGSRAIKSTEWIQLI